MQINSRHLALLSAAVTLFAAGCGDPGPEGGGVCTTDADCLTTELCHPTAKECVQKCAADSECPTAAPKCSALANATTSSKFCQCTTDTNCGGGTGSTAICSNADKICATKCSTSADCQGRPCDAATGQCLNSTEGASCSTATAQPDSCDNGQFCSGTTAAVCAKVAAPTCSNFTAGSHAASWTAANNAPVIYEIGSTSVTNDTVFCGGGAPFRFKAQVKAYWKGASAGSFSAGNAIESQVHYVNSSGSEVSPTGTTQNVTLTNSNKNVTFTVNLCRSSNAAYSFGIHFVANSVTGNEYCATIQ